MKEKNISRIIAAFACGLTVVALVEIHGLNKKLENMEQNMNNGFYQVSENVNAIDNRIYAAMEEETNLLALQNWEYKEVDVASKKVKVQAEVLPKEYFPEKTEAVLIYEEKEYPMTFSNGKYTAVLDIPLCEESVVESVVFKEDGTNRSQKLEWYLSPRTEYLPYVYARFEGSTTGSASGEMYQYSGDGLLVTEVNQKEGFGPIREMNLITVLNGKETERTAVDLSYEGQTAYLDQAEQGSSRRCMPEQKAYEKNGNSEYYYYLNRQWEKIPKGSVLEFYAEVVDSYGLHYRALYDILEVNEEGKDISISDKWGLVGGEASIYDDKGNILYDAEALYR